MRYLSFLRLFEVEPSSSKAWHVCLGQWYDGRAQPLTQNPISLPAAKRTEEHDN